MKKIKVLMATAEMAPFVKVGGLADVLGSLPTALAGDDCETRVVLPLYGSIDRQKGNLRKIYNNIAVFFADKKITVSIWQANIKKVKVYFIECQQYFGQKEIYWQSDNAERFLFFSQVILSILPILKFKPDIIHCHDYHTAMIPFLLKFTNDHYFDNTKTILTIHNLQYQGRTTATCLQKLPFVVDFLSRDSDINFMEQGIIFADCITTVSPTYATEIMTKEFGAGLEKLLRKNKHKLMGILNGIDQDFFNPARDRLIVKNFSASNLATKKKNKEILQKISGLSVSTKPLVGLISRFVEQKGLDLITEEIIGLDCQFVFLGTGMVKYEDLFKAMAKKYPEKFSVHTKFDLKLAQLIYAGADIFLMPSRFEPCGLGQMIAMRYGTVPLARTVGGLADTVFDCQVDSVNCQSNGFSFKAMTVVALKKTLKRALEFYNDKEAWQKIQERGMTTDFSWQQSAQKYIALYQEVTAKN